MAQKGVQLDQEAISCSICLDLLKDPVTIPCGHSYCMNCIKSFWDGEDEKKIYSCPQCRQTFTPRPVLMKSTMLADLVEERKKTGLQAAPADHCYAGPEDVACDVCTGRKLKAFKSCLACLASYCEKHLQPHYDSAPFKKHKLVEPSKKLQENICSRHDEVMKIFCRTDQQCICYLCLMDEHKGHDTVSAAAERTERQRELEVSRLSIQQRIQDREKDVKLLQQEVKAVNRSADKAVEDSEKIFTELIRLMEKRSCDVKQQVRSQQKSEVSRVKELQEKLEQEITELKRRDAELKLLSHTEDHDQFLLDYPSLSPLSESTHSSSINIRPLSYFEDVTAAVSEVRDKLQDVLSEKWTNVSQTVTEVDVLLSQPEPKTRAGFLKYSREITLDPNTAYTHLLLSEGNRKATAMRQHQSYSSHPDRFTGWCQVLSRESLTGRCYWEVEWRGRGVDVAVAYKSISRAGGVDECGFGYNDKSWALRCDQNCYIFFYNNVHTPVSGPLSSRVGVYLDHSAGILSFYSVSETMTLLHRVQTTFTEPLYAGLWLYYDTTAELCKLKYCKKRGEGTEVENQQERGSGAGHASLEPRQLHRYGLLQEHGRQSDRAARTRDRTNRCRTSWTGVKRLELKLVSLPRGEMAQKGVQLDQEAISCSICLDLLKDPVATSCGHSYCMNCIKSFWDGEDEKKIYSCPQCRQTFTPRPVLMKNTMLAVLVEKLKKTGLQAAPADHCYAGPEDVACDVCTGRKLKAFKSCLVCLASYCEKHLQPHYDSAPFKKHKLAEPSKKLQENICSRHDEVMKMFCRTDRQCICYLCSVDEHKGHDTVSAAAERTDRQRELEVSRLNIQQRIQDREKDVKLLQQEVEAVNRSADKAVEDSEKIFTELIRLMEKRSCDVKQQVRSQQKSEVSRVKELQEKLEQEITELKRRDAELKLLSHTEDHSQFLLNYPSLSPLSDSTHSSSINIRPLSYFEDVRAAVSEVRDKLQDVLREKWTNVSQTVTEVDVLLSQPEPKTRAGFLEYSQEITLDPNTAYTRLLLSEGNRKATFMREQSYPSHPDRFTVFNQVLSRESLTGRCYWEVERRGGGVYVAVAYKSIRRAGGPNECGFGRNDKSWALRCDQNSYIFWYNDVKTPVSGPLSSRVGVYLDHSAGILSFYSISGTMTLLHRVQTTFTEPLYAGLWLTGYGTTAELCKLK
ncbi:E3 ubiquitin/ISG15 ligase TRIM25-like [Sebastes umbrosus]|uniref:E3 ubiquitin/ISG15 ligase TRIM25-like n=1 Tax=Sebastes umbrosus TaxID=72105 RepID=UPI00189D8A44|nr:E3 ubiquitin/ISG15 ligase TRIM25-like [Sebastes umbrosus]